MNFYVSSTGQILQVDPEDVFQGSVNANTINFIGAFPPTCPVDVAFRLPTGEWTTPASMGMHADLTLPGVQQPNGTQFNIWRYTIPGTVTEYYGTVNLQFYVYAQGGSGIRVFRGGRVPAYLFPRVPENQKGTGIRQARRAEIHCRHGHLAARRRVLFPQ